MTRPTSFGVGAIDTGPEPAVEIDVDRDATDDEFEQAYQVEKPRWAELADRLK
jgi:hypothetical protein